MIGMFRIDKDGNKITPKYSNNNSEKSIVKIDIY